MHLKPERLTKRSTEQQLNIKIIYDQSVDRYVISCCSAMSNYAVPFFLALISQYDYFLRLPEDQGKLVKVG